VQSGSTGAGDSFVLTTEPNTMIIGYTALTYTQFSGGITYTGGTNIDVTGQVISVTGAIGATNGGTGTATVTTGDLLYGSGTNTWGKLAKGAAFKSLVMDGSATNVEWNAVALNQSGAVSGALGATNGGTGLSSYTLGDTIYSSAANTLLALAGNTTTTKKFLTQTGTGAASAAPSWGTVDGADVTGNISGSAGSVANALTLGTYLTGTSFNGSAAVTATVDATATNTASKVVARDSSGNFSAGTITATLSGSSTSATTATNLAGGANLQIPYQTASGTTSFITAASGTNYVLNYTGSAFSWVAGTISGVALGSNLNSHTAGTYLTGTAYNGSAAQTWAVDATSANTASKVVARDASGNFSAGTITAALTGNASTATTAAGLSATLAVGSGGTGLTTLTAGYVPFGAGTSAFGSSANLFWDSVNSRLGIGTTSPADRLHVKVDGNANNGVRFENADTGSSALVNVKLVSGGADGGIACTSSTYTAGAVIAADCTYVYASSTSSNGLRLNAEASAPIVFGTNNTEKARLSSTGGFGVGTTADPGAGAIYATGNITAYYSSDIKFKENVRDIPDALATVNAIGGKLFDWKDSYITDHGGADGYFVQKADFGVVAQDVQKVFPIAVRTREDGSLAVDYEKLGALAFAALVELTKRVEALEAKG
jgi:hypothetical protein